MNVYKISFAAEVSQSERWKAFSLLKEKALFVKTAPEGSHRIDYLIFFDEYNQAPYLIDQAEGLLPAGTTFSDITGHDIRYYI